MADRAQAAIREGDLEALRDLLDAGMLPDACSSSTRPLLHCATIAPLPCLHLLLDRGADIDALDSNGLAPIAFAGAMGGWLAVKALLDRGAHVLAKDASGRGSAFLAVQEGRLDILKALVERGAPVHERDDHHMGMAFVAATQGREDCLLFLIEQGVDLEARDASGWSAAAYAACNGQLECLRILAQHGANLGAMNDDDPRGCVELARIGGHEDCAQFARQWLCLAEKNEISQHALPAEDRRGPKRV